MEHTISSALLEEVIARYPFAGELNQCVPYGSGHINDTYLLTYRLADGAENRIILQRI